MLEQLAVPFYGPDADARTSAQLRLDELIAGDPLAVIRLATEALLQATDNRTLVLTRLLVRRFFSSARMEEAADRLAGYRPATDAQDSVVLQGLTVTGIREFIELLTGIYRERYQDIIRRNICVDCLIAVLDATRRYMCNDEALRKFFGACFQGEQMSAVHDILESRVVGIFGRGDFLQFADAAYGCISCTQPTLDLQRLRFISDCAGVLLAALGAYANIDFKATQEMMPIVSFTSYRRLFYRCGASGEGGDVYRFEGMQGVYGWILHVANNLSSIPAELTLEFLENMLQVVYCVLVTDERYDSSCANAMNATSFHLQSIVTLLGSPLVGYASLCSRVMVQLARILFALRQFTRINLFLQQTYFHEFLQKSRQVTLLILGLYEVTGGQDLFKLLASQPSPLDRLSEVQLSSDFYDATGFLMRFWNKFMLNLGFVEGEGGSDVVSYLQHVCSEMFLSYLIVLCAQLEDFCRETTGSLGALVANLQTAYQASFEQDLLHFGGSSAERDFTDALATNYGRKFRNFTTALAGNSDFNLLDFSPAVPGTTRNYDASIPPLTGDTLDILLSPAYPPLVSALCGLTRYYAGRLRELLVSVRDGILTDATVLCTCEASLCMLASHTLFSLKVIKPHRVEEPQLAQEYASVLVILFDLVSFGLQANLSAAGASGDSVPYIVNRPTLHMFSILVVEFLDAVADFVHRNSLTEIFKLVARELHGKVGVYMPNTVAMLQAAPMTFEASGPSCAAERIVPLVFDIQFQLNLFYSAIIVKNGSAVCFDGPPEVRNRPTEILSIVFALDRTQPSYLIAHELTHTRFWRLAEQYNTAVAFRTFLEIRNVKPFVLAPLIYTLAIGPERIVSNFHMVRGYYHSLTTIVLRQREAQVEQLSLLVVILCNLTNLFGSEQSLGGLLRVHQSVLSQMLGVRLASFARLVVTGTDGQIVVPVARDLELQEVLNLDAQHLAYVVSQASFEPMESPGPVHQFLYGYIIAGLMGVLRAIGDDPAAITIFLNVLCSRITLLVSVGLRVSLFNSLIAGFLISVSDLIETKKLDRDLQLAKRQIVEQTRTFTDRLTTALFGEVAVYLRCANLLQHALDVLGPVESDTPPLDQALLARFESSLSRSVQAILERAEYASAAPTLRATFAALLAAEVSTLSVGQKTLLLQQCRNGILERLIAGRLFKLLATLFELGSKPQLATPGLLHLIALLPRDWLLDGHLHDGSGLLQQFIELMYSVLSAHPVVLGELPQPAIREILAALAEAVAAKGIGDTRGHRGLVALSDVYLFVAKALLSDLILSSFNALGASSSSSGVCDPAATNAVLCSLSLFATSTTYDMSAMTAAARIFGAIMDQASSSMPTVELACEAIIAPTGEPSPLVYPSTARGAPAHPLDLICFIVTAVSDLRIRTAHQSALVLFAACQLCDKRAIVTALTRLNTATALRLSEIVARLPERIDLARDGKEAFTNKATELLARRDV
ncbi:hypothetical protein GMRT_14925 [Giardia muris]|uniref:Uncharacterized protein n=1 Tax=Giardia muris TaxID=5742 RepID=A0A4Z1T1D9_GIAMU|nr:hypothetical protein GMRT_14925 [Giardia muris]|eukprot:TNJ27733.1 hypothetical protein GMRT_14925 [Giardia muris]